MGYNISTLADIEGSNGKYQKTFKGDGGINHAYWANAINITKNLALGIETGYLFGNITETETVIDNYSLKELSYLHKFYIDYGLNYTFRADKWNYNIGLIYGAGTKLHSKSEAYLITTTDTINLTYTDKKLIIPRNLGGGIAVSTDHFRAGIDYELKKWSDINSEIPRVKTRNSQRISMGLEFTSGGGMGSNMVNNMIYRIGAEYSNSYLVIGNIPINYRAVSIGTGIPLNGSLSVINLSFEAGQNGSIKNKLIRENIYTLNVDIALSDRWFVKRKYY